MSPTNLPSVKDTSRTTRATTVQPPRAAGPLSVKQRDFLLLNIYVLAQNGFTERASTLAQALHVLGDNSAEVTLARAVLGFFAQEWGAALACLDELDRIDPIERFGAYTMTDAQRLRRYLKARCFYQLNDLPRARDVVESYLRHGSETADQAG
ncbi:MULTISPECIES: hypothetical protein [Bradyrhizobium]|uniref:hypothetical protein n=1 Tax=Bradyrhizobium TaxID=374 RepID=UPI001BA4DE12|nr:hypothetical protein [Bradyrhizobium liaoningense]MBR0988382.1 hypothetical protein [Bradyrhizobium liaoningense]GMO22327.1 hypothetical protein TM233_30520 [Bradyrhizobium sp. TM233]